MGYIIALLTLCLLSSPNSNGGEKLRKPQRVGDLLITFVGLDEQDSQQSNGDHHLVLVRLRAENIGKQALCASFSSTLKATFGLQYQGSASRNPFRIHELLPGEMVEGEYEFLVKNGAEPLQVALKPISETQTCVAGKDSLSAIWHSRDEVTFDLAKPPSPSLQDEAPQEIRPSGTPGIRVFLTGTNEGARQVKAMKAFRDHCPQAQVTTEREKANYVVRLTPKSLKQNKNLVVVTNKAGDVIHSGATLNLGNAAKDACAAIVSDFGDGPK